MREDGFLMFPEEFRVAVRRGNFMRVNARGAPVKFMKASDVAREHNRILPCKDRTGCVSKKER